MKKEFKLPKLNNLPRQPKAMFDVYTKEQMEDLIDECKGIISLIVLKTGYNYKQIYNCLDHYKLRETLKNAKNLLVSEAEKVMLKNLNSDSEITSQKAAEFILKSKLADEWRVDSKVEVNATVNLTKEEQLSSIFGV